ncbi:MAG: MltA domain-containing protein [Alphaproteobacteria bacterium]|nr:MltA domain-containing protein [Alphaproteobacteria bacterium]|tara:strand:+ start:924 stop:2108 length:1185 start_codon:yes stop_codon:yes gene_type:complete
MSRPSAVRVFTTVFVILAAIALWLAWWLRPVPGPGLVLQRAAFSDLAGWQHDDLGPALSAFRRSCERLFRLDPQIAMAAAGQVADWHPVCKAAGENEVDPRDFFESRFVPFATSSEGESEGLFTGYYEPELRGSRQPGGPYTVPLYGLPDDLISVDLGRFRDDLKGRRIAGRQVAGRLQPYPDRGAIIADGLDGHGRPLFWVDDAVAAFFLHIQGSGRILLPEGGMARLGFAATNGHVYFAIGRELVERGALEKNTVSLQSIRRWLVDHPSEAQAVMNTNRSFVFFRELEGEGPLGAGGTVLTPGRSLAVDRRFLALGLPLWLDSAAPGPEGEIDGPRLQRLMVSQDTGGAIRGAVRGDVFFGHGAAAENLAGHMQHRGRYFVLLPNEVMAAKK